MGKPHNNAEYIQAYIEGKDVEARANKDDFWSPANYLNMFDNYLLEFRVKPEIVYPETSLSDEELMEIWEKTPSGMSALKFLADQVIKRHCQDQEKEGK